MLENENHNLFENLYPLSDRLLKKHTLYGCTYLYSRYKGISPSPSGSKYTTLNNKMIFPTAVTPTIFVKAFQIAKKCGVYETKAYHYDNKGCNVSASWSSCLTASNHIVSLFKTFSSSDNFVWITRPRWTWGYTIKSINVPLKIFAQTTHATSEQVHVVVNMQVFSCSEIFKETETESTRSSSNKWTKIYYQDY